MKAQVHLTLSWQDYRMLAYERDLGLREVRELLAPSRMVESDTCLELSTRTPHSAIDLTYFSKFQNGSFGGETRQFRIESSASESRHRRQPTRYSVHGLHEYKGKFNPQTAKALLNVLGLRPGHRVLDPFCGSGTTIVECCHNGFDGFGVDLNPLAVFISRAKLAALEIDLDTLRRAIRTVVRRMGAASNETNATDDRARYLRGWFPKRNFDAIERLRCAALRLDPLAQLVVLALGSNLLRDYSLQEPADLRIRRRSSELPTMPIADALETVGLGLVDQLDRLRKVSPKSVTRSEVLMGSAADLSPTSFGRRVKFDAAVCSPPYATALPYIDTQRLSIVWLGLARPDKLRRLESALAGNREMSSSQRTEWNTRLRINKDELPEGVAAFCQSLLASLGPADGFRRLAVPGLLYKYFVDMRSTLKGVRSVLKTRAKFALIVGQNHTTLGGRRFDIPTPKLLAAIAETQGFHTDELLALQTYQRYGLHSHNAVSAETLIVLEAK